MHIDRLATVEVPSTGGSILVIDFVMNEGSSLRFIADGHRGRDAIDRIDGALWHTRNLDQAALKPRSRVEPELVDFGDLPLGAKFSYQGSPRIWVVLKKWRETEGGAFHGEVAQWEPDMLSYGRWPGQAICVHRPESGGGDCPEKVIPIG